MPLTKEEIREISAALSAEIDGRMFPAIDPPSHRGFGGFVYFIQCATLQSPVKIGLTDDVARRLKTIRSSCPAPASLVAAVWTMDAKKLEQSLHRRFQSFRIHGEWFAAADPVLDLIRTIRGKQ